MRKRAIIVLVAIAVALAALLFAGPPVVAIGFGDPSPIQTTYVYAGVRG